MSHTIQKLKSPSLISLILFSILLCSYIEPVEAQTASFEGEPLYPSTVGAGHSFQFWIDVHYETREPVELRVTIISIDDGVERGGGLASIIPEGDDDSLRSGDTTISCFIEAITPVSYDEEGRFLWALRAELVDFDSYHDFWITILRPDTEPFVRITRAYPFPLEMIWESYLLGIDEPVDDATVGEFIGIWTWYEFVIPSEHTVTAFMQNSLDHYPPGATFEGDWCIVDDDINLPGSRLSHFIEPLGVFYSPVDNVIIDIRLEVETVEGDVVTDEYRLEFPIVDVEDRSAWINMVTYPYNVAVEESFNVEVLGGYVFPGDSSGDLHLTMIYADDGSTVAGGEEITLSDRTGRSPFSHSFTLTAPSEEGDIDLLAVLTLSDDPTFREEFPCSLSIEGLGFEDYSRLTIEDIQVNGGEPPQDIPYEDSFMVRVYIVWSDLPEDANIQILIWDWEDLVFPIGEEVYDPPEGSSHGARSFDIEIDASRIPPRNGPWTLRAEVKYIYRPTWDSYFTPDGYEEIFEVNVVGAEEGVEGGAYDWSINGVTVTPVDPFLGTDVTFTAYIGVEPAPPTPHHVEVVYAIDGDEQPPDFVLYEGGDFVTIPSPPWTPAIGDHTLRWEVDPNRDYDDPNRDNNVYEVSFTVSETPPLPPEWEPPLDEEGMEMEEEFDFYVTITPSEQVLASSVSYTIDVEHLSGPPYPVLLEIKNAPPSVSVKVDPPSGTPPYSATLTVTENAPLRKGTYALTVKASGDEKEQHQTVTFIVEEGPDYQLTVDPRSIHASPGDTVQSIVAISSENGYTEFVNLMVSNLPDGVQANVDPLSNTPDFTSTLQLDIGKDVEPGVYHVTVSGSGVESKRARITLFVKESTSQQQAEKEDGEGRPLAYYLPLVYLALIVAAIGGGIYSLLRMRRRSGKSTRYCLECGKKIPQGSEFCSKCGTQQNEK